MLSIYDEETGCASERGTNQRIIIFAIFLKSIPVDQSHNGMRGLLTSISLSI